MQHQGRHFLQIPGPSPVPDRVLRAMDMPVIDHRSAQFAELATTVFQGCQKIFQTSGPVIIFPSSGTGAWEAAIVNTLSPGDKVLMVETGHFATLWRQMAARSIRRLISSVILPSRSRTWMNFRSADINSRVSAIPV